MSIGNDIHLDRTSSVPLYRQLAEELRYQIATGTLKVGDKLPPVAEAADMWGVNLHTVRQAYKELTSWGVAEMQRAKGTFVAAVSEDVISGKGIGSFLEWVAAHAKAEFGLDRQTLADLLTSQPARRPGGGRLYFVECSATQANQHAEELNTAFGTEVSGWSLDWEGEPPPGSFIATYFHYNDIRSRWPHRMKDAVFVVIQLARSLADDIDSWTKAHASPVVMVEREEMMGKVIAADVKAVIDETVAHLETQTVGKPAQMALEDQKLYLFAPRLWAGLTDAQRASPQTRQVTYEVPGKERARLAHRFGWAST